MDKPLPSSLAPNIGPTKTALSWQRARRQASIARVKTLLEHGDEHPLRLSDLCREAGVSERTLRSIFQEMFGVGPHRYLHLCRLQRVRTALSMADPGSESVSRVAARFGFSDSGRMACDYHRLFGEYPSDTLKRRSQC